MNKNILVIDDVRLLDLYTDHITYARTGEKGLELLKSQTWDELHIDFDLDMQVTNVPNSVIVTAVSDSSMNGVQVLLTAATENITLPPVIRIISTNPEGIPQLKQTLLSIGYKQTGITGKSFVKQE